MTSSLPETSPRQASGATLGQNQNVDFCSQIIKFARFRYSLRPAYVVRTKSGWGASAQANGMCELSGRPCFRSLSCAWAAAVQNAFHVRVHARCVSILQVDVFMVSRQSNVTRDSRHAPIDIDANCCHNSNDLRSPARWHAMSK